MDDEKRWQDMDSEEQAKRITELEHRIETLEARQWKRRKQRKDF
jgi:polyhydroxyalkanoate synthesis regulator phasin